MQAAPNTESQTIPACCQDTIKTLPYTFNVPDVECDTCHTPLCCDKPMVLYTEPYTPAHFTVWECHECGKSR